MVENKSIIRVDAKILKSISVSLFYADNTSKDVIISEGDTINITYIPNGATKLIQATGRVKAINTYYKNTISSRDNDISINTFNIELDCSSKYQSDIRNIQVVNIREINVIEYPGEDEVMPICN